MLPNIDTIGAGTIVGGAQPQRHETDRVAEAYRAARLSTGNNSVSDKTGIVSEASRQGKSRDNSKNKSDNSDKDQAELNFSLSREERDAFISAFSDRQDPSTMSEEEKETLRKASERIAKFIDDAIAKNHEDRVRVEKAVGEWYARISKGDHQGPVELIALLRAAAMGEFDELYGESPI